MNVISNKKKLNPLREVCATWEGTPGGIQGTNVINSFTTIRKQLNPLPTNDGKCCHGLP